MQVERSPRTANDVGNTIMQKLWDSTVPSDYQWLGLAGVLFCLLLLLTHLPSSSNMLEDEWTTATAAGNG
ncbi:unnamed protein product [Urochloa humidicola]